MRGPKPHGQPCKEGATGLSDSGETAMSAPDPVRVAAGRYAYTCRRDVGDPQTRAEAFRDLTAVRLEKAIREAVEAAPPLTPGQRADLAAILTGGGQVA